MRYLFLLLISLSLFGRDNPFFPSDPNAKQTATTNQVETLQPFSEQSISLPDSARAVRGITIEYQNMDGSIHEVKLPLNRSVDWHDPFVITQKNKATPKQRVTKKKRTAGLKFIHFTPDHKTLHVNTKDKLLRHFMLTNPYRVVLDFQRDTSFKPKEFKLDQAPYKKIRMGNHDHYYRVVIELDGQYRYKINNGEKAMQLVCY